MLHFDNNRHEDPGLSTCNGHPNVCVNPPGGNTYYRQTGGTDARTLKQDALCQKVLEKIYPQSYYHQFYSIIKMEEIVAKMARRDEKKQVEVPFTITMPRTL